jgi:predicted metal-binding protein
LAATGPTPATWETDVLFVCLRCSGKVPGGLAEDGRTTLRQWVREKMTAEGRRKALRVVETSCLGLCPDGRIAVAVGRELAAEAPVLRSVATDADRDAIYRMAIDPA